MLIPVILAGGAGTRLWPVSRKSHPKPFMRVAGDKTLLTQTYERALAVCGTANPLIVTNQDYYFLSRDDLAAQQVTPSYLLEPGGRNTAPAIALAALQIAEEHPEAVMLVLPADHLIRNLDAFRYSVEQAAAIAAQGALVLFGIPPTGPETGYGYIEMGEETESDARKVARFVEKPDVTTAAAMLSQGRFVWNSGMFAFKASSIIKALQAHCPALMGEARSVWKRTERDQDRTILPREFSHLQNISIDYAVFEHASNTVVLPAAFDWSDIGAWDAVAQVSAADAQGNTVASADTILIDSSNTHVHSDDDGRLVALIGVDNLLVVDTPDALLIADKRHSQEVKQVVTRLAAENHDAHHTHRTVVRPWGTYTVLQESDAFKIKRIIVRPGASLSLQMHHYRSEHWIIVSGTAEVTRDDAVERLTANQSTYIPAGCRHRLHNPEDHELTLIEVQCGSYLGEDDIVRFEDVYGRAINPVGAAGTEP